MAHDEGSMTECFGVRLIMPSPKLSRTLVIAATNPLHSLGRCVVIYGVNGTGTLIDAAVG